MRTLHYMKSDVYCETLSTNELEIRYWTNSAAVHRDIRCTVSYADIAVDSAANITVYFILCVKLL